MLEDVLTSGDPGEDDELFTEAGKVTLFNFTNSLFTSPCSAKGAGSIPLRVNLSARDAKHLKAPSDTCKVLHMIIFSYIVHIKKIQQPFRFISVHKTFFLLLNQ